jgi:hypothetical protein
VLLGQDRSDEAYQGITAREDPDDVGPAADLAVQPFLWVVGPDLAPDFLWEAGEREHIGAGRIQVGGYLVDGLAKNDSGRSLSSSGATRQA